MSNYHVYTAGIGFEVQLVRREFRTPRLERRTSPRSAPVAPVWTRARWHPFAPCLQAAAAKQQSPRGIREAAQKVAPKYPAAVAEARMAAPAPRQPPRSPGERPPPTPQPCRCAGVLRRPPPRRRWTKPGQEVTPPISPVGLTGQSTSAELLLVPATFTQHSGDTGVRRPSAESAGSVQGRDQLPSG